MASKKKGRKGRRRRGGRRSGRPHNAYVQRLVEDDELRDEPAHRLRLRASKAYGRMSNGKGPTKALDDKKVQKRAA